jgi:hypothetical protein
MQRGCGGCPRFQPACIVDERLQRFPDAAPSLVDAAPLRVAAARAAY